MFVPIVMTTNTHANSIAPPGHTIFAANFAIYATSTGKQPRGGFQLGNGLAKNEGGEEGERPKWQKKGMNLIILL
jgi:hypothetical protein